MRACLSGFRSVQLQCDDQNACVHPCVSVRDCGCAYLCMYLRAGLYARVRLCICVFACECVHVCCVFVRAACLRACVSVFLCVLELL